MISNWESEKERLLRHMKIPAKKKLEWLREINEFIAKYSPRDSARIRRKLREGH